MLEKSTVENVLFVCAHNDDQIIGGGGTIAKYAKEGKNVFTYIFSFGVSSHPHFKPSVTAEIRVKESIKGDRILGGGGVHYFDLKEGRFEQEVKDRHIKSRLKKIIQEKKPVKLFTHSIDDPHPDHRAVYRTLMEVLDEINYAGDVYSFNVWNFSINIRRTTEPKLVVDITEEFPIKIKAFKVHKSQKMTMFNLLWSIYLQAILNGLHHGVKYAEVFQKAR